MLCASMQDLATAQLRWISRCDSRQGAPYFRDGRRREAIANKRATQEATVSNQPTTDELTDQPWISIGYCTVLSDVRFLRVFFWPWMSVPTCFPVRLCQMVTALLIPLCAMYICLLIDLNPYFFQLIWHCVQNSQKC